MCESKIYINWLYHIPGIGRKKLGSLLAGEKSPGWLYGAEKKELLEYVRETYAAVGIREKTALLDGMRILEARKGEKPRQLFERIAGKNIFLCCKAEKNYPKRLRDIPDAPIIMYGMGGFEKQRALEEKTVVAVVGTRSCTQYGKMVAERIGELCADLGMAVVSGMAMGVDGIVQSSALEKNGTVAAVLGCGVDVCYPWENRVLYKSLSEKGLIYSEYVPGTEPKANYFPPRNRIISGMADAVIVVEAKEKSGTLITVDMALEQGKDVYVIPGRLVDPMSRGCNKLIAQGAVMITDIEAALVEIDNRKRNLHRSERVGGEMREEKTIHKEYLPIMDALDAEPRTVQEIYDRICWENMEKTKYTAQSDICLVQQLLIQMEMLDVIGESGGRFYKKYRT